MKLDVRPATESDAPALALLNEEFNGPGGSDAEGIRASLRTNKSEIVLIACADGEPAGFCCARIARSMCYTRPVGEVTELYVRKEYRRLGLARTLIQTAVRRCQAAGTEEMTLLTGEENLPAQALYESLGFRRSGEAHYEYGEK